MAINKFVDRQGNTLLDLSVDTVSENRVLAGTTYHGPDGAQHIGTLDPGPLDYSQYNFIDYDGTLLYSYTDEELDALTALPAGPDHTGDNLTFQSWNWSLADLKAWDRTRPDRPIVGANLITTDGKSYLYLDTPYYGATLSFSTYGTLNSVDWGDGTVDTNKSHVYTNPGQYVIVIDMGENSHFYFGYGDPSKSTNKQWIKRIKLGNIYIIESYAFTELRSLESITIPINVKAIRGSAFYFCKSLKSFSIPNGIKGDSGLNGIENNMFGNCFSLKSISIPNGIKDIRYSIFTYCYSLQSITIPNGVTTIQSNMFRNCNSLQSITIPNSVTTIQASVFQECFSLQSISIPDSVTKIEGNNIFSNCYATLDLSKQSKVITLTGSIGLSTIYNKILVPSALLSDYKSASYWSDFANIMVGV